MLKRGTLLVILMGCAFAAQPISHPLTEGTAHSKGPIASMSPRRLSISDAACISHLWIES
jgi:hypothetical protein